MSEACPLITEIQPTEDEFVFDQDVPESCLRCLYRAQYGEDARLMLASRTASTRESEHVGIKIVQNAETGANRFGFRDHIKSRDSTAFICGLS